MICSPDGIKNKTGQPQHLLQKRHHYETESSSIGTTDLRNLLPE